MDLETKQVKFAYLNAYRNDMLFGIIRRCVTLGWYESEDSIYFAMSIRNSNDNFNKNIARENIIKRFKNNQYYEFNKKDLNYMKIINKEINYIPRKFIIGFFAFLFNSKYIDLKKMGFSNNNCKFLYI